MTNNKAQKTAIRQRMAETGEPYSVARRAAQAQAQADDAGPTQADEALRADDPFATQTQEERYIREAEEAGVPEAVLEAMRAAMQAAMHAQRRAGEMLVAAERAQEQAERAEEAAGRAKERAQEAADLMLEWAEEDEQRQAQEHADMGR